MVETLSKRKILRIFKMRGLSMQSKACDATLNVLSREEPDQQQEKLELLLSEIKKRSSINIVTTQVLSEVVASMTQSEEDVMNESMELLQAFDTPRLWYDDMRKRFTLDNTSNGRKSLHADADVKVNMMQQRHAMIQQRIVRQDFFRPKLVTSSSFSEGGAKTSQPLTTVDALLGRSGIHFLLGFITQVEEGRYYLEDMTGHVPISFESVEILSDGFITENCVVVVEGEMQEEIFLVHKIGHPPPESRENAVSVIGTARSDLFGVLKTKSEIEKVRQAEVSNGLNGMFVVLSDVHLDNLHVMEKLEHLFQGFQNVDPLPVFIFFGNFTSKPFSVTPDSMKQYIGCFEDLSTLILKYPNIANNARFILIPGPSDPGSSGCIFPRAPIPEIFTQSIRSKIPHVLFGTNPCRIRYFSKEILLFRNDLVMALKHHCLVPPPSTNTTDNKCDQDLKHAIQTIMDQGHLSPLPLTSTPIYWNYDHAMRIYPLPDALILGADRLGQYYESYFDSDVVVPGSFPDEFNFVVYKPVVKGDDGNIRSDVEFSQID